MNIHRDTYIAEPLNDLFRFETDSFFEGSESSSDPEPVLILTLSLSKGRKVVILSMSKERGREANTKETITRNAKSRPGGLPDGFFVFIVDQCMRRDLLLKQLIYSGSTCFSQMLPVYPINMVIFHIIQKWIFFFCIQCQSGPIAQHPKAKH